MNGYIDPNAKTLFSYQPKRPTLYDYQARAVDQILLAVEAGMSPAYCLPTAGGKGVIIGAVAEEIERDGWEVWFFAHRVELIRQISEHVSNMGIEHGIIAPGMPLTDHKTQVCSVDTVIARLDKLAHRLERVRLVVDDEAHHTPAEGRAKIRALCKQAQFLGFSATFFRLDGKPLNQIYDLELRGPSIRTLENRGFISRVKVIAPPTRLDLRKVKKVLGDYSQKQLDVVMAADDLVRASLVAYAQHAGGLPTLAFCPGVATAVKYARAFAAAGWNVAVLESKADLSNMIPGQPRNRSEIIGSLARGRTHIVFQVGMAGEGTDIPVCSAGLDLRPTQSTQLWLQHVGRTKRIVRKPGMPIGTDEERVAAIEAGPKPFAIWIDMAGNWKAHGLPNADRKWSLAKGLDQADAERVRSSAVRCGKCYHVSEAGSEACPECGRRYPMPKKATPIKTGKVIYLQQARRGFRYG